MNSTATAKLSRAKISPKKVAPVLDLVRGKNIMDAKVILALDRSKAAKIVLKVVQSAEANALNVKGLEKTKLFVSEIWVGGGPMIKSGEFVGRGRFNPILKRSSHIYVGLSERSK